MYRRDKMKKFQFTVEYNEEKIKAIKVSLKDKGKELDEEIIKYLDVLYNKNVPKLLKKYIEQDFKEEDKTEDQKKEKVEESNKEEEKINGSFRNN